MLDFEYTITTGTGGEPTPITLSLSANRTSGTAPMGLILEADGGSPDVDIPYHDIHYTWDMGDSGTLDALDSDMPWGRDRGTKYGPVISHVFDTPGSYVVTCTARDGTNSAKTETITITVNDPDTVFSSSNTAVISSASNFTGAPSGASQYTSFAAALAAKASNANQRYLFRDGETHTTGGMLFTNAATSRLSIGAFPGTGTKPIIDEGLSDNIIECRDILPSDGEFIVSGLDLRGDYDPTVVSPVNQVGHGIVIGDEGSVSAASGFKTIWNTDITGPRIAVNAVGQDSDPALNIVIGNTEITEWLDYGFFSSAAGYIGVCGSKLWQPGDTINGAGEDVSPYYADHGPFRISRQFGPVCHNLTDLKSFNSWAASTGDRSFQPTFRCNTGQLNQKISLDRIRSEGGSLSMENNTGTITGNPGFHLCDKAFVVFSDHPVYGLSTRKGGTTYRNVIAVVPNTPCGTSTGLRDMTNISAGGNEQNGNLGERVEIYNCTLVDLRSDANASSRTGSQDRDFSENRNPGDFTVVYVGNNNLYAPNMSTGAPAAIGVSLDETAQWTPVYGGERWESATADATRQYGNEVTADFQPAGTVAASGKTAIDDFYGTLRPGSPSKGAVEP